MRRDAVIDYTLSALHFVLVLVLVAVLAAQAVLIRPGMRPTGLRLAANLDRSYGMVAMLLLGIGFARVFLGAKGSAFYISNPMFWAKLFFFGAVALLSIAPTLALVRWTKQARVRTDFVPPDTEIRRIQRWLLAEGLLLAVIPWLASAMARGIGHL